ncbi:tryptophan--tRNA ligase [Candidatus Uhrbacteria bacterium RIFCSPHIGHO2_02_FULL_53_13]|uniref:Tryptophan--tRNA ligase n=2 Tax=Candidatus Uhriibacteriota TaxID=1752732 RepID=A0A1F7U1M1_9BACT|nr:MAG: tryptophan--tRNA ligase [Candidatus Uhrbacteria bacterium RIFCSPHIGHO2_02_FULL_53_13]OGL90146.1 MAG: tryptophan--tRNA ligase [Candidatus Uhrbacteria bacterium RIFCSPLOWO2_02_FULL_53_10]
MRFLSGIRPTNLLHIGNYFGAMRQFVEFQKEHDGFVMIADLHALDTETDATRLHQNILTLTATYLAVGLDAQKNILFLQSSVPEHTELAHIFSALVRMSELERMTQYKDKAKARNENVPVALFTYPLLMAADILMYEPDIVPVGDDQTQHVEMTRDIAERFNRHYGETFRVPKLHLTKVGARVMGLDDPTKKMSKSAASAKNYIALTDDNNTIRKKIMSAVTDSNGIVAYADDQPGIRNLIDMMHLATGTTVEKIAASYDGKGYGDLKRDVAEAVVAFVEPLRTGIVDRLKDKTTLAETIKEGSNRARALATKKMESVRKAVGIFA